MSQSVQQGWNQATAAMKAIMGGGIGSVARRATGGQKRKRRASSSTSTASRGKKRSRSMRRSKRASGSKPHLVKGSAAAKRYMAKLRKMVGKRR